MWTCWCLVINTTVVRANVFRSSVADWIIHHHPPFSILLARPPRGR